MPKKKDNVTINFISKNSFANSSLGKVVDWAMTIGKIIVFITFAVVMGIFIYRFSLDRKIAFFQKSINDNIKAINQFADIENDIRLYQDKLNGLDYIFSGEKEITQILTAIESRLPEKTNLKSISFSKDKISLQGNVRDEFHFVALLNSLKKEDIFTDISVSEVTSGGVSDSEIDFSISIQTTLEEQTETQENE